MESITQLSKTEFDIVLEALDFHLRQEAHSFGKFWTVDCFKKSEQNSDKAHQKCEEFTSLSEALAWIAVTERVALQQNQTGRAYRENAERARKVQV